jgi:hypothetical protein
LVAINPKLKNMKKVKLALFAVLTSFVMSCGDDSPLKDCAVCKETSSGTKAADYCANKAAVETYIIAMENQGYECSKK